MAGDRTALSFRKARDQLHEHRWGVVMAKGRESFATFCAYFVNILTEVPGQDASLAWNEIQRRFYDRRSGWDIVLKARRVGFTTVELARDLWFALTHAGASVGVVVPPHKENLPRKKVISTFRHMIKRLGRPVGASWGGATCTFSNGASVTVLDAGGSELSAGKLGRGDAYHRLHVAELAHYPYAGEMLEALLPTVPQPHQGGELVVESTPRGVGGAYYEMWQQALAGTSGITPHFYPWWWMRKYRLGADETPAEGADASEEEVIAAARAVGVTLSTAQMLWWRQRVTQLGLRKVHQEFPHDAKRCFLLSGESYFDADALERLDLAVQAKAPVPQAVLDLLAANPGPAQPYIAKLGTFLRHTTRGNVPSTRVWYPPEPGASYVLSVDCAGGGVNGDWLVGTMLRRELIALRDARTKAPLVANGQQRYIRRHDATLRARVSPPEFARWCARFGRAYGDALIAVERNGHGGTVLHVLEQEIEYPHLYRDAKGALGWFTGPHNRTPAIDDLGDALVGDELLSHDPIFAAEARTFVRTKNGKIAADKACNDDMVMALAIGHVVICGPRDQRKGLRDGLVPQVAP